MSSAPALDGLEVGYSEGGGTELSFSSAASPGLLHEAAWLGGHSGTWGPVCEEVRYLWGWRGALVGDAGGCVFTLERGKGVYGDPPS